MEPISAKTILNGYVRVIQKARSTSLESVDDHRVTAELLDPVLFSEDTDKLLVALAHAADNDPTAQDAMNFSRMMSRLAESSIGLGMTAAVALDQRYNFIDNPLVS